MNVLDLFSGIGGFSLGLERCGGFRTIAFCELAAYPRAVLAQHWPDVPCYGDVRDLSAERLQSDGLVRPDLICGGFPCQDISLAGLGAGIDGARSGLWREMARIVSEVRPRWVVAENVAGLRRRGADRVLGDLEALGYACWPLVVGAVHAGAWHRRQRVWIVGFAADVGGDRRRHGPHEHVDMGGVSPAADDRGHGPDGRLAEPFADAHGTREHERAEAGHEARDRPANGAAVSDIDGQPEREPRHEAQAECYRGNARMEPCGCHHRQPLGGTASRVAGPAHPPVSRLEVQQHGQQAERPAFVGAHEWAFEPDVVRVVHGVPARVDRIEGLGNAVVPACAQMIGRAILAVERAL